MRRINYFSGKGGVGKTSLAYSYALWLSSKGHTVLYYDFEPQDEIKDQKLLKVIQLDPYKSAEKFISLKLYSTSLAKWISRSKFFRSVTDLLPGFHYLLMLGEIVQTFKDNPEKMIVIDSPASGHTQILFQSAYNFEKIFSTGPLGKDLKKILDDFLSPDHLQLWIPYLPGSLPQEEAIELGTNLSALGVPNISFLGNQFLSPLIGDKTDAPAYFKNKLELEKPHKNLTPRHIFSYSMKDTFLERCEDLKYQWEHVV